MSEINIYQNILLDLENFCKENLENRENINNIICNEDLANVRENLKSILKERFSILEINEEKLNTFIKKIYYHSYRMHTDNRNKNNIKEVPVLTEFGLQQYIEMRQKELLKERLDMNEINLIMDFNLDTTSEFNEDFFIKLKDNLDGYSSNFGLYIIHRDGHTVSLIRENDTFLLLDSYNAHGVIDDDNIPLLTQIRNFFPDSNIYTLHDRIQSDYNNCRIFAFESLVEIKRYLENNNISLEELIKETKENISEIYNLDYYGNKSNRQYETIEQFNNKNEAYKSINIEQIPIPIPIVPMIQSMSSINIAIKKNQNILDRERINEETYRMQLNSNIDSGINKTITNMSNKVSREIPEHILLSLIERANEDISKNLLQTEERVLGLI